MDRSTEERFWAKVNKDGPTIAHMETPCWVWIGRQMPGKHPYGYFSFSRRVKVGAHRVSWSMANGPVPPGLFVLHTCDNPPCVNPAHLRVGTAADNSRDAKSRGRLATGDRHSSRTHPELVPRGDRSGARTRPDRVPRGERHGSVTHPESRPRGERSGTAKLTVLLVVQMRQDRRAGVSFSKLAKKYNMAIGSVFRAVRGTTWVDVPNPVKE